MIFSRLTLATLLVPSLLLAACGGGSTSTTGAGGAGGGGTSAATSTGDTSSSASTTTSSTTTSSSTTASSSSSTTGSSSSSSTTSSTSSGGMLMNACLDMADQMIINDTSQKVGDKVGNCAQTNLGQEPATKTCIKMQTMLSDDCVTCFDDDVQCIVKNCLSSCLAGMTSPACKMCQDTNCNPAFKACSGLNPG